MQEADTGPFPTQIIARQAPMLPSGQNFSRPAASVWGMQIELDKQEHRQLPSAGSRRYARGARLDAAVKVVEALGRARHVGLDEGAVDLVHVGGQQRRGVRVGARDEHGRHAGHVGRQARGDERAQELAGRDEHLRVRQGGDRGTPSVVQSMQSHQAAHALDG